MKKTTLLLFLLSLTFVAFGQTTSDTTTTTITQTGIGFGAVLAIVTSWDRNKSILWAILHGFFGWIYVIYFAITRK